jgi:hypothetical protein
MTHLEKNRSMPQYTWMEIVAVPTGYIIHLVHYATFVRKNIALTSAQVSLLCNEVVQDLVYYTPR